MPISYNKSPTRSNKKSSAELDKIILNHLLGDKRRQGVAYLKDSFKSDSEYQKAKNRLKEFKKIIEIEGIDSFLDICNAHGIKHPSLQQNSLRRGCDEIASQFEDPTEDILIATQTPFQRATPKPPQTMIDDDPSYCRIHQCLNSHNVLSGLHQSRFVASVRECCHHYFCRVFLEIE